MDGQLDMILSIASNYTHVKRELILSKSREARIAFARQVAMYLSRQATTESFPTIAKFLGRDHSTVIHGCDNIKLMMNQKPEFGRNISQLVLSIRRLFSNSYGVKVKVSLEPIGGKYSGLWIETESKAVYCENIDEALAELASHLEKAARERV